MQAGIRRKLRSKTDNSDETSGFGNLTRILGWPLQQLMKFALDHPWMLQAATRVVSKVPFIYNILLRFAQRNKIVLAPEEPGADPFEINDPNELTARGKAIYTELQRVCTARYEGGR
jgi:hypothetical protein